MCAMQAWKDDIEDESRKLLEWAADVIRQVVRENHRLSHRAEQVEGDNELLFHLHYGPQKGGAALTSPSSRALPSGCFSTYSRFSSALPWA